MNRTLATLSLLGVSIASASVAQAQSVPLAETGVSTATQRLAPDPKGTAAPQNGTAEEAYVKEHIRGAGYTGVNSLYRDGAGTWHALAYKGEVDVEVALDQSGRITESAHP